MARSVRRPVLVHASFGWLRDLPGGEALGALDAAFVRSSIAVSRLLNRMMLQMTTVKTCGCVHVLEPNGPVTQSDMPPCTEHIRQHTLTDAHKLATADSIVFATARARNATLLTCDVHFKDLPGVTLVEKIKT